LTGLYKALGYDGINYSKIEYNLFVMNTETAALEMSSNIIT